MFSKLFRRAAGAALALALALTAAPAAHAAWSRNPYAGNNPVCTNTEMQDQVQAVSDGAGGTILVWQDLRNGNFDLYAQRLGADGAPLWTLNGVAVCTAPADQGPPVIVSDGAGGAVIAWQDLRSGTSYDVYAQRVGAGGTMLWAANGVGVSTGGGGQTLPVITEAGGGSVVIAWSDTRTDPSGDAYAQRLSAAGAAQWTANGIALCAVTGTQNNLTIVHDGAGGAIVAWEDYRSGASDLYAQRVNSAGAPQFAATGLAVAVVTGEQSFPRAVPDGTGGAVIVWQDSRVGVADLNIYAQRVAGLGVALWTANGVPVCTMLGSQYVPKVLGDGAGGAIVAWEDWRAGGADVYAQRLTGGGAPVWTSGGIVVTYANNAQNGLALATDGAGGAFLAWEDWRSGSTSDIYAVHVDLYGSVRGVNHGTPVGAAVQSQLAATIVADGAGGAVIAWTDSRGGGFADVYAQRMDEWCELGQVMPKIRSVRDVANDQGGFAKLTFAASPMEVPGQDTRGYYFAFRAVPLGTVAPGTALTSDPEDAASTGKLLLGPFATAGYAWEIVDRSIQAIGAAEYSMTVPTTGDSLPGSNPRTAFMVSYRDYRDGDYRTWYSAPDSGYSVDNLAPATPSPFAGARAGGSTRLTWWPNHEADLAGYHVYRGIGTNFVPSGATRMASLADTGYAEAGTAPYVWKVTAVDLHGNESPPATYAPGGTVDAPVVTPTLAFGTPTPNPARGATTLRWSLPVAGSAKLELYDAAGRRVRVLHDGHASAGEHVSRLELRDASGRALPSGVYLARLEAAGQVRVQRVSAIE